MAKATDVRPKGAAVYVIPAPLRVPLKFGIETVNDIVCARVKMTVTDQEGNEACGWGETPVSAAWAWPSTLDYGAREKVMLAFCEKLAEAWASFDVYGHPMEVGHSFLEEKLESLWKAFNAERADEDPMPWLAALICCCPFDIALHDAYGILHDVPIYDTYNATFMNGDLSTYLTPAEGTAVSFEGLYPEDFFATEVPTWLPAWHLVGGKDLLDKSELTGSEPNDGYPVLLEEWIERDGLKCLKVKLRGNDADWDYERMVAVGEMAIEYGAQWLSPDFNCTVQQPEYVNDILDRLRDTHPRIYGMVLYVEQPFPYDLEENQIDVHSVSSRKPLFMDESAHDWHLVKLGRSLGWTGVALKTCKTQTGALLSMCWAKAHGMTLMVQDLTNPMLAMVSHVMLAAHAGTIMGVEVNSMQFYPDASLAEEKVHPGLFKRREGGLDLTSIKGPGFGYRVDEIECELPTPVVSI